VDLVVLARVRQALVPDLLHAPELPLAVVLPVVPQVVPVLPVAVRVGHVDRNARRPVAAVAM